MDIERLEELRKRLEYNSELEDEEIENLWELIDEVITIQTVTSEEVQRAIKRFEKRNNKLKEVQDNGDAGCVDIETWERYQGFIEDNNLAITALKEYQPWIPVSERLPENCESYLVVVREEDQPNDLIHVDVASSYGKYIDDFWDTFNDWKEGQEVHITHWKPLPGPPKGE